MIVLFAPACDRKVGTLDLYIVIPWWNADNPFASEIDAVSLRVEASDLGVSSEEFQYVENSAMPAQTIPAGSGRIITLEGRSSGGTVLARGRSLPVTIGEGHHDLHLYMAWEGRFSSASAPADLEQVGQKRGGHQAIVLADGRVALIGGGQRLDVSRLATAEIQADDPALPVEITEPVLGVDIFDTNSARIVRSGHCSGQPMGEQLCMRNGRIRAAIGRTAQGDILVAGGELGDEGAAVLVERLPHNSEFFDVVGNPLMPRLDASLVQTSLGALLVGGWQSADVYPDSALLFGSSGDRAEEVANLLECPRASASVAVVKNYMILYGGVGPEGLRGDYELLDLASGVRAGGCLDFPSDLTPRVGAATTIIEDRLVVFTGGLVSNTEGTRYEVSDEVTFFDVKTGIICLAQDVQIPRFLHGTTSLPDGRVFIVGGVGRDLRQPLPQTIILDFSSTLTQLEQIGISARCEDLENPVAETDGASLPHPRIAPSVTTMGNDFVLVAGGFDQNGDAMSFFEIYVPRF